MNAIQFADKHFGDYKVKGNEIVPKYCPYCNGGKNRDKETFAFSLDDKLFNCKRGTCGVAGNMFKLCKDFGEEYQDLAEKVWQPAKVYKKINVKVETISKQARDYLKLRGFSDSTVKKKKIGSDLKGNLILPYYEKGQIVFIKYRPARKVKKGEIKCWREKDGKPIFWGIDDCVYDKPLIITEGEMDAMAVTEAGVDNVVSVPSGTNDLTCIDICWEWLQNFREIILWGDNDEPGKEMIKKIVFKLGEWRCRIVESTHKDANMVLIKDGKEKIKELIDNAKHIPKKGLLRLADAKVLDITSIEKVLSGFKGLDDAINGFILGEVSVWSGINSSGKSSVLSQVLIEAVDQGFSTCLYSGEMPAAMLRYWVNLQVAGEKNILDGINKANNEPYIYIKPEVLEKASKWYGDKFYLFDTQLSDRADDIFDVFEYAVKRHDVKVFVIDNLMTVNYSSSSSDFYMKQSEFVGKIISFAQKFNVHVHLVAHPRKTSGELTKQDVAGTGDITNKANNVFMVKRLKSDEKNGLLEKTDTLIGVMKSRFSGKQDIDIGLKYNDRSRRFSMANALGDEKEYGWVEKKEQQSLPDWMID